MRPLIGMFCWPRPALGVSGQRFSFMLGALFYRLICAECRIVDYNLHLRVGLLSPLYFLLKKFLFDSVSSIKKIVILTEK